MGAEKYGKEIREWYRPPAAGAEDGAPLARAAVLRGVLTADTLPNAHSAQCRPVPQGLYRASSDGLWGPYRAGLPAGLQEETSDYIWPRHCFVKDKASIDGTHLFFLESSSLSLLTPKILVIKVLKRSVDELRTLE